MSGSPQERLKRIQDHLKADKNNKVMVATPLKATVYGQKHIGMFKATDKGLFVQRGKSWDCIDYCSIRFGGMVKQ